MTDALNVQENVPHPFVSADFRWLWLSQAISTFGDRFTSVAVPILIYDLTNSSFHLGVAFMTQVLAAFLFGLLAGTMSDRWDRKETMIVTDWLRGGLVALIPLSLIPDLPQAFHLAIIYMLSFAVAATTQFFTPAKISIIPQTVSQPQLVRANSLDQGTNRVMEFIGYSMAGVLIYSTSISIAFFIDAITFVLSAICVTSMRLRGSQLDSTRDEDKEPIIDSIRAGLAHVNAVPILRRLMAISLLAPLAIGALQPLHLLFVEDWLGVGEVGYGFWQASVAVGVAAGVFAIGRFLPNTPREDLVTLGVFGFGFFQLLALLSPMWLMQQGVENGNQLLLAAIPFVVLLAASNGAIFLGIRVIVQENAPNEMIGRVFGAITVVSSLAIALGQLLTPLTDIVGAPAMIVFWSLFMVFVGAAAYWGSGKEEMTLRQAQDEADHGRQTTAR